jgi:hypothetical protein
MDWNKLYEILDCDQVAGLQEYHRQHLVEKATGQEPAINIVLKEDGPDSMFVEIETDNGKSINIGTRYDCDSYTRLRITADEIISACSKLQPEPEQQFVTRDEFEQFRSWLSQQRTAEWTRLMEHSHANDGTVVFQKDKEE